MSDRLLAQATLIVLGAALLFMFIVYAYHRYQLDRVREDYARKLYRIRQSFEQLTDEVEAEIKESVKDIPNRPLTKEELADLFDESEELRVGGVSLGSIKDLNKKGE